MQGFSQKSVALQNARYQADYSCEANYDRQDTLAAIDKLDVMLLNFDFIFEMIYELA